MSEARHPVRCPGCGRESTDGPAYLLLCPDCAQRPDPPLRALPQAHAAGDTACGGLCQGTELVWEDLPGPGGEHEQRLVPCPDCGTGRLGTAS